MIDRFELGREFFECLKAIDEEIVERAAREPCPNCRGALSRSDYPRKPRWGAWPEGVGALDRRFSLCCSREGCRRRATPPSVRFLGRRVYAGPVVVLASAMATTVMAMATVVSMAAARRSSESARKAGVPARTVGRWLGWWQGPFASTASFLQMVSRLLPPPERGALPASLLERLGNETREQVRRLLGWIAPETTESWPDGSRLVRGVR